jgi:cell division initiation protein
MRVTPLDILQKEFSNNKKGFDPDEVKAFLEESRETLEDVLKENQDQRMSLAAQEKEITRLRENEDEIKKTLLVARKLTDDMSTQARREADLILGEARLEAQRVLTQAHDEHRDLLQEVVHLKGQRFQLIAGIRGVLEAQSRLMDEIEAQAHDGEDS